jgi:integrase
MPQGNKPLAYIKRVTSRGKVYEYFDTGKKTPEGKRILNPLPKRSDRSFGQVYAGMVAGRHARANVRGVPTMKDLAAEYQRHSKFTKRAESTQNTYLIYLKVIDRTMGMAEVNAVERRDVQALMDSMAATPGAANMTLLVLRNLFKFAKVREYIVTDPTESVELNEAGEGEHEPWPEWLIEAALDDPAVRLPVALLYFTAQRISDVCKMRWTDIRDGYVQVQQQKTGKLLDIRLHQRLAAILATTPHEAMTVLYGAKMRPRRPATLRWQLQAWATKQGQDIVPHGLRKNAVNALLECGCSVGETAAISGQSLQMVEHYSRRMNTRSMGSAAILKWQGTDGQHRKHGENAA